jgi:hypothetical protein
MKHYRHFVALSALIALSWLLVAPASAWWPRGHAIIAKGALKALPADVPAFFRDGGDTVGHLSYDPDVLKARETPALRSSEEPEHYLDLELLGGKPVPRTRYEYYKLCSELGQEPTKVGTLPYSVTEWTERLTVAFAEHRKWPKNPIIRMKTLVYAGMLAHYAGDLCMPLHTTVHFNGRAKPDGTSPRTGIHERLDSLIERLDLKPEQLARDLQVAAEPNVLGAVVHEIDQSHRLVEKAYSIEDKLPPRNESAPWTPNPEATGFGTERGRAAVRFLATLYATAWKNSEMVKLPAWLEREALTGGVGN